MSETDLWFGTLSATVRVEDLPASRQVVAIERQANGDWRVCGQAVSNAEGIATLPITGLPTSRIYAIAIDEWGKPFAPGMTVAYGDVIRPTQFLGWMYQVTSPGVLPGTEPEWWNSMAGVPQPVGTAMMQAVRHYQPVAHGPVSDIEWEEQGFDPYWDNVVALLHFDGVEGSTTFTDETGTLWERQGNPTITTAVPGPFGGSCAAFSGGGRILSEEAEKLALGTEDFTLEFFVRRTTVGVIFDNRFGSYGSPLPISVPNGQSRLSFRDTLPGALYTSNLLASDWYHYALVRDGGTVRHYLGGVRQVGEYASTDSYTNTRACIGAAYPGPSAVGFNGYIAEFRITKGVARYTENFNPPTAPFPNVGPPL